MHFNALRSIIKNIRSEVHCPHCDATYTNDDLSVVSAVDNRCVLLAQCHDCHTPILITAAINERKAGQAEQIVTEKRYLQDVREEDFVSSDDVLKIHEMLKDYKGDLGQLFHQEDSSKGQS